MRVISLNVNGLRSAAKKGLFPWLAAQKADVVCLQEIKAHEADLDGHACELAGFERHLYPATRKGYAGVALYSRAKPDAVTRGFGVRDTGLSMRTVCAVAPSTDHFSVNG